MVQMLEEVKILQTFNFISKLEIIFIRIQNVSIVPSNTKGTDLSLVKYHLIF